MNRIVPFEPGTKCDICDKLGASDFMGYFICDDCAFGDSEEEYYGPYISLDD